MEQFADRKGVIAWLNGHVGKRIRLSSPGTTLRVVGVNGGVEEIDACSTDIFHTELRMDAQGVQVGLTLHDDVLALHVLAGGASEAVSVPFSLPYARVRLELSQAGARPPAAQAPAPPTGGAEEREYSPYELLHRGESDAGSD